jgi:ribosome biogenesis protein Nip4
MGIGFSIQRDSKLLKIEGTEQEFDLIFEVMESSHAPYVKVRQAQRFLYNQLRDQVKDTANKKANN